MQQDKVMLRPLDVFKQFDFQSSTIALWAFKKSHRTTDQTPIYTGRWVGTTDELDAALKVAVTAERERITETQEYGILAQNNEGSVLTIETIETHAALVIQQTHDETIAHKVTKLKDIDNTVFYVVKFTLDGKVAYAVRKTDNSWKTKKAFSMIQVLFSDDELDICENRGFNISKHIDFFIIEDIIFISSKQSFESVLNYKEAHKQDFISLQQDSEFSSIFSSIQHIVEYVGENKMHLRRISSIRQKGHYKSAIFMSNLRKKYKQFGLNINFDIDGKISPCANTCKDIFQALLDHRLISPFLSTNIYDVQNTDQVHF